MYTKVEYHQRISAEAIGFLPSNYFEKDGLAAESLAVYIAEA